MKKVWIALAVGVGLFSFHSIGLLAVPGAPAVVDAQPLTAVELATMSHSDPRVYRQLLLSHAGR